MPRPAKLPPVPIPELREIFSYDPDTGALRWSKPRTPRQKVGQLAGFVRKDGIVVTLDNQHYLAMYLCWALHYGQWPTRALALRNTRDSYLLDYHPNDRAALRKRNLEDLRIENIVPVESGARPRVFMPGDKVPRIRGEKPVAVSAHTNVVQSKGWLRKDNRPGSQIYWAVYHLHPEKRAQHRPAEGQGGGVIIGKYLTLRSAELAADDHARCMILWQYPPPQAEHPNAETLTAGPSGQTLADLQRLLIYDAASGVFIWRADGIRADQPDRHGIHHIKTGHGRSYFAHMLAWFFEKGVWPAPKSLIWLNGDKHDNRLDNLAPRAAVLEPEWRPLKEVRPFPVGKDDKVNPGNNERRSLTVWKMKNMIGYDPETGELFFQTDGRHQTIDPEPGHIKGQPGYFTIAGRRWPMHMVVVLLRTNRWPSRRGVTWINGLRDDLRLDNLKVLRSDFP